MISIIRLKSNTVLTTNAKLYDRFFNRFIGLMFKREFTGCEGIILKPCKMIHTYFMNFPIDVVFLDVDFKVIYMIPNLKPWKTSPYITKARSVLEFPRGFIRAGNIKEGDILKY